MINYIVNNNILSFDDKSGQVFFLEKVDDNYLHIGYDNQYVGITVSESIFNNLTFENADGLMVYLNSIITLPIIENPNE